MKLNKLTTAMLAAGMAVSGSASAFDPADHGIGDLATMSVTDQQVFLLAEYMVSLTAARVSADWAGRSGNDRCSGSYDFSINPNVVPVQGVYDGLILQSTFDTDSYLGQKYTVADTNGSIADFGIDNFAGTAYFSEGNAILLADATFDLLESGATIMWDEHVIKDLWDSTCDSASAVETALCGSSGKNELVRDTGVEVVTKLGYPVAKWLQDSIHIDPDGGYGYIVIEKQVIADATGLDCEMVLFGIQDFDRTIAGTIDVTDPTPAGPTNTQGGGVTTFP